MLVAVLAIIAMQSVAQQGFTVTMPNSKMSEREITNIISQTEVTDMGAYIAFWLQGETHPQYIYYSPKEDRGLIKMETK